MRTILRAAAAAAILFAASQAAAQTETPEPRFTPEAFRAHVAFLADDLLEGREAGTRGHELAALYVATRFQGLGLQPGGEGGDWYQRVPLQERALESARLTLSGPATGVSWANGEGVIISPSALEPVLQLEAPLVFVGFGLDDRKSGFDDYRGLDVRGKIVVALEGAPQGTPSEIGAHLNREKARMAMERGAVGFISVPTRLSDRTRPWSKRLPGAASPRMSWLGPDGKPDTDAPALRATAVMSLEAAGALFQGSRRSLEQVLAEADRPGARIRGFALPGQARFDIRTRYRTAESPNVIGVLPGADPELKDEVVVVMAHLDHLGLKVDGAEGDRVYNGAMDNGTGVATMLETARAMARAPDRPRRTVLFMATTGEEKGLLGADYFGAHPVVPLERIAGLVNMDMPILTYDFADIVPYGADSSTMGVLVARAAGRMGVAVTPDPQPQEGIFTRSDHYGLVKRGVPSVFLKTGPLDTSGGQGGAAANTAFRSTQYHEVSDEMDLPFSWEAAARFARLNWMITRELANADERPRWYAGDFFGETFAPDAPKAKRGAPAAAD